MQQITRKASYYRPMNLPDGKEINQINIYSNGKILYTSGSGWLEVGEEAKESYYNFIDTWDIWLKREIKRALVKKEVGINLNRKDNFIISNKAYYDQEPKYALYINAETEGISIEKIKEFVSSESPTTKYYAEILKIEGLKVKTEYKVLNKFFVISNIDKEEEKSEATKIKRVQERLNKVFRDVSIYDVEKFLKEFKELEDC